ncbi:asparagine synthase C-terminal domain-containing protein [Deltaproteobacteria bacterium]|nr:asparagine synthase C-terminal domain-containing protein [Deltaproteobacteria bacterium]
MNFQNCFGKKFLAKTQFASDMDFSGVSLCGSFFYRNDDSERLLNNGLDNALLSTLTSVSKYIDGAFTLIFIDSENGDLLAVTDPYGLNKLYYRKQDGQVQLTDDLGDFLSQEKLDFSSPGLHEYLRFLDISAPSTCFEGISILDGGTILKVSQNGKAVDIIDCNASELSSDDVSYDEAVNETRTHLINALSKRLDISGKIGLFLSGGVDSSLLAGLLAEMGYKNKPEKVIAYTVGFNDSTFDESPIAESVASHLGIAHKVLRFDVEEEYAAFHEICALLDVPFADPAVIPTYLSLKHMRNDGVTGVMEGTGADGLLGASLPAFYHRVLKIDAVLPKTLRMFIAGIFKRFGDPEGYLPYFDFEGAEEKFIRWKGWTRTEIESLCSQNCDFSDTAFYRAFQENRDKGAYELYRKLLINMPDFRITDTCRLMGFEPVFPFFDQGLRGFVDGLPIDYKYRQGENKALFKSLLAQMVPRSIWDVPKHGFDYPFEKLLLHKDADLVSRYLNKEMLERHGFFDVAMVEQYCQRFIDGDLSLKFKIWNLVIFQCWYENYYMQHVGSI